jgi:hypothetical protein
MSQSRNFILQGLQSLELAGAIERLPSATRRYSRVKLCATRSACTERARLPKRVLFPRLRGWARLKIFQSFMTNRIRLAVIAEASMQVTGRQSNQELEELFFIT